MLCHAVILTFDPLKLNSVHVVYWVSRGRTVYVREIEQSAAKLLRHKYVTFGRCAPFWI